VAPSNCGGSTEEKLTVLILPQTKALKAEGQIKQISLSSRCEAQGEETKLPVMQ
jgi:hypothetical protein